MQRVDHQIANNSEGQKNISTQMIIKNMIMSLFFGDLHPQQGMNYGILQRKNIVIIL